MCIQCKSLIKAINIYIKKADDDFRDILEDEGRASPDKTMDAMNEIENGVTEALLSETDFFINEIKKYTAIHELLKDFDKIKARDICCGKIKKVVAEQLHKLVPELVKGYVGFVDKEIKVISISRKAYDWIDDWSEELADIMKLSSHTQIEGILKKGLDIGSDISSVTLDILNSGIRNEYYRARTVAVTEILRAHNVSKQEAMMQNPCVKEKMWLHTGEHKNKPRDNHVAMNGQKVPKAVPFELIAKNGDVYHPMYPTDPVLPPEESINCHCIAQAIVDEDILAMPLEERQRLQQQAVDEINAENEDRPGASEKMVNYNWLKRKTVEERKKYFRSDSRWALFESGVLKNDKDLEKLYKIVSTPNGNKKVFKSLTELKNDGIITVSNKALKHSTVGDFANLKNPKKPPSVKNGGKMKSGGHSQANIDLLESKGYSYTITKTYDNGVRVGNVSWHKENFKKSGSGQSWFPEKWSNDDVLKAGTYVANNRKTDGITKFAEYNGVRVGVYLDENGEPSTIFPDNSKQP